MKDGDADAFMADTHLSRTRPRALGSRLSILFVGPRHHQWMYDGESLCRLLQSHGFINAESVAPGQTKIPDPGKLDLWERSDESVYVEAENP